MPDYKDYVKNRNFDAAGFKEHFGLESKSEGDAYSKDSSTGTKQVGALGTYMDKKDYNRLKNDDKIWDLYAEVNGQDAADKKREGNQDGLSIDALDGLLDKVSAGKNDDPKPTEPEAPVSTSPRLAEARARVSQYEEDVLSGRPVYGKKSFAQNDGPSFLERYKLKLQDQTVQNEAGNYVDRDDAAQYDKAKSDYETRLSEWKQRNGEA